MAENTRVTRYMVTGGFLGAGKTTSTIAFAKVLNEKYGIKPSIIANDLGVKDIVDSLYTETTDYFGDEITGNCICYLTDELVFKIKQLVAAGSEFVLSDLPGCCVGALEHVYGNVTEQYPGQFELAPFTTIVDPDRLAVLQSRASEVFLPDSVEYILDAQLKEGNFAVLNKIDLLTPEQVEADVAFLKERYPDKDVMAMSAKTGEGVEEVVDYLMSHSGRTDVSAEDIGYCGPEFGAAMSKLGWFNRRTIIKTNDGAEIDFNEVIDYIIEHIRDGLKSADRNVGHMKWFAKGAEGDFHKGSMVGIDHELSYDHKFEKNYNTLVLILNSRNACEADKMLEIIDAAYESSYAKFNLNGRIIFTECWDLMDEGNN